MNSAQRAFKKMTIVLVIFSVLGLIGFVLFQPEKPKCSNGQLDEGEEQIDCGGFCEKACPLPERPDNVADIKINWTQFIEDGRNNYDFVASLTNDNESWGVARADYSFAYFDADGNELGKREGEISIAPRGKGGESSLRYLVEENIASNIVIDRVDFKLSGFEWKQISDEEKLANLHEDVVEIRDKKFEMNTNLKMYAVTGKTYNSSVYDFEKVDIATVLFGPEGNLVAAGRTDQDTMIAGDGWGFQIPFPNLKGKLSDVSKIDLRAYTDVFDENNFIREYRVDN